MCFVKSKSIRSLDSDAVGLKRDAIVLEMCVIVYKFYYWNLVSQIKCYRVAYKSMFYIRNELSKASE